MLKFRAYSDLYNDSCIFSYLRTFVSYVTYNYNTRTLKASFALIMAQASWKKLTSSYDYYFPSYQQLKSISRAHNELFIIGSTPKNIYKYHALHDEWQEIAKDIKFNCDYHKNWSSLVFDEAKGLLLCWHPSTYKLTEYDIRKNVKTELISGNDRLKLSGFSYSRMICVDNLCFMIGGGNKHFVFDRESKILSKFECRCKSDSLSDLLYLKSKKTIVYFNLWSSEMHALRTWNNKWVKKRIRCKAESLTHAQLVCSANEQYIICLGGIKAGHCYILHLCV